MTADYATADAESRRLCQIDLAPPDRAEFSDDAVMRETRVGREFFIHLL
jgi:hypothetical protein